MENAREIGWMSVMEESVSDVKSSGRTRNAPTPESEVAPLPHVPPSQPSSHILGGPLI
jgi:hypothetical protein